MPTPDWVDLANTGDLTAEQLADEAAELRRDIAGENLVLALVNAVQALERHGFGEQAEQLGNSFLRAFKVPR